MTFHRKAVWPQFLTCYCPLGPVGTKKLLVAFHVVMQVSKGFPNGFRPVSNEGRVQTKGRFVTTRSRSNSDHVTGD